MADDDWGGGGGDEDGGGGGGGGDDGWGKEGDDGWGEGGGEAVDAGAAEELSLDLKIENAFHEAEGEMRDDPKKAIEFFGTVLQLSEGKWAELSQDNQRQVFRSYRFLAALQLGQKDWDAMGKTYQKLLGLIPSVTRNEASEAVFHFLETAEKLDDIKRVISIYDITTKALSGAAENESLLFDVRMRLCNLLYERRQLDEVNQVLRAMHQSCQTPEGKDDLRKGSQLLEVYAFEFRLCSLRGDSARMKELFNVTAVLSPDVKDPRSQSIIHECWGVMFADELNWVRAKQEFYTAFNNYLDIGNKNKAVQCLQYYVVSHMLSGKDANVNPLQQREAKVFEKEKEIQIISQLRAAYEASDVNNFNKCLWEINKAKDVFLLKHLDSMVQDFQSRAVLALVRPYRRVKLAHIADSMRLELARIEEIMVQLILDGHLDGRIDQIQGILDMSQRKGGAGRKYKALDAWSATLQSIVNNLPQPAVSQTSF